MFSDASSRNYIELIDSLVPALAPPAAVAFGLAALARARLTLAQLPLDSKLRQRLERLAEAEEAWWAWCGGSRSQIAPISKEARDWAEQTMDLAGTRAAWPPQSIVEGVPWMRQLAFTVVGTSGALFEGLERGDYECAKRTVVDNISVVEGLEEQLDAAVVDGLLLRETARQEAELLVLSDGFGPGTRARLHAVAPPQPLVDRSLLPPIP